MTPELSRHVAVTMARMAGEVELDVRVKLAEATAKANKIEDLPAKLRELISRYETRADVAIFGKPDQPRDYHGRWGKGGAPPSSHIAPDKEFKAAFEQAQKKIANAPVPSEAAVKKARDQLELARQGKIRAGGYAGGNSKDRKKQRLNLYNEFGGEKRGYVPCHGCGTKLHHDKDNEHGYAQLERGKIFVKAQGGGYQLPNLLPECFGCNRSRNDQMLRPENKP